MTPRDPLTLDELVSAARDDGPALDELVRLADEMAPRVASPDEGGPHIHRLTRASVTVPIAITTVALLGVLAATREPFGASAGALARGEARSSESAPPDIGEHNRSPSNLLSSTSELRVRGVTRDDAEPPTMDVRSLPTTVEAHKTGPAPLQTPSSEDDAETALLRRAHAALATDPQQALAFTAEHERRFSRGMLEQEREIIAIKALERLGRTAEVRERAASFFAAHPKSAYRYLVDEALGSSAATRPSSREMR